jgi:hypothetical protein
MEAESRPPYEPPPFGDERHAAGGGPHAHPPDPAALFQMLDAMRRMAPRELEGQLTSLIREFLLTLRALIDWYLERLDRTPAEPKVEDIPID